MKRLVTFLAVVAANAFPSFGWADGTVPADLTDTSRFVSLSTPCRLADSRIRDNTTPITPDTFRLSTAERCGLPPDVTALSVSAVGIANGAPGFVVLYEAGIPRPDVSHVNFAPGETRANGAIVPVSAALAAIDAHVLNSADVVVDVTGYFVRVVTAISGRFVALPQRRLLDTRELGQIVAAGMHQHLERPAEVPEDAMALIVNLTATATSAPGFLAVAPSGADVSNSSALNWDRADQTRAASSIVAINSSGFDVHVSLSDVHLVVDIVGYMTGVAASESSDGLLVTEAPRRLIDTRSTSLLGTGVPLYPQGAVELASGAQDGSAYITNLTMIAGEPGFLTASPAGVPSVGSVSSVNTMGGGDAVANLAVVPVSSRGLEIQTLWTSHVIVDYFGHFTGSPAPATQPPRGNSAPVGQALYPYGPCDTTAPDAPGLNDVSRVPAAYRRIGTSVQGRPIWAEYWGPLQTEHTVIVIGHTHGDECSAAAFVQTIRQRPPTDFGVWVIPALNVDGYVGFTRNNANGVDLNRDGLLLTQPESQALITFTGEVQPVLSVHAHSPYGWIGFFGSSDGSARTPAGAPLSFPIASQIAARVGWPLYGAGERPADQAFLWQGQRAVVPGTESILIEFAPASSLEAPIVRSRALIEPFWWVAVQSYAILDVLDEHL
jgi:hypothetical protein